MICVVLQHLFVEVDVDEGIVHSAALGQVDRHCANQRMNLQVRVVDHQHGQAGIRQPTDQKCHDHQNHHRRHPQLRLSYCTSFQSSQL